MKMLMVALGGGFAASLGTAITAVSGPPAWSFLVPSVLLFCAAFVGFLAAVADQ